ncbi:MAG: tetratricopeptide repeat protein [Bryobacteraceae bacterium]|nr:tetratricopeptide repeat protein [Bryobacteraceae bacterium]
MKKQKRPLPDSRFVSPVAAAEPTRRRTATAGFAWKWWHGALLLGALLLLMYEVYAPALRGPMVFDDGYLVPGFTARSLPEMLRGLRPATYASLYFNYRASGLESTFPYHLLNLLFHTAAGLVVFFLIRRLLLLAGSKPDAVWLTAAFAAGLFLLHPLQTEGVAYITSRSEVLSVFFAYAAIAVFLGQQPEGISGARALAVLFLFGLACLSKEHAAALPAAIVVANYYWFPGFSFSGLKRNWRLYAPMALGAVAGGIFVLKVLLAADTAGFGMKDLPWHHYFWTQCRAIWSYLRLFLLPLGQSVDHDFAISRGPFDHLAIAGLAALLALAAAAWVYRRRFPLASFGVLLFLILIAPTSSFVPIRDLLVERRFYLPSIGAILVVVEFVRRWNASRVARIAAFGGILATLAVMSYSRNAVWASELALWKDALDVYPAKARPNEQYGFALYQLGRCQESLPYFQKATQLSPQVVQAWVNRANAEDCAGQTEQAVGSTLQAVPLDKTGNALAALAMFYGKLGRNQEAMAAAEKAIALDPGHDMAFLYRGNLHRLNGDLAKAAADYRQALALNPQNEVARQSLNAVESDANRR